MINDYLRGRACNESVSGSWFQGSVEFSNFELFFTLLLGLPLFMPFVSVAIFPSSRLPSWTFLGFFSLLAVLHGVLDLNFKLCAFCYQWTHQGGDWETKWSVPWFECDESLTWQGLNSKLGHFDNFTFIFVSCGELRLLVSWCAGGRCDIVGSDEDHGRSRRPGAEDREWSHRSGTRWPDDREAGWCRVWSAPCTWRRGARVSWLSLKTKVDGLSVVWPQNH
jgi:hypothetical protein